MAAAEILRTVDPAGPERQQALRDRLHRLDDMPGCCRCRYDRLKNDTSPGDFTMKDKKIGLERIEANLMETPQRCREE